ncbi:MAG: flagellar hook-basal body protein [Spirochaetaceae bacterium]|nr:flagellar hook-basal body protein [Spirochaetaceae bacterium]
MLRGLWIGTSGMQAQEHRLDVIANNLANVDTNGFKRDVSVMKAFPELLIRRTNDNGVRTMPIGSFDTAPIVGRLGTGVEYNETYTAFEQGSFKETGNDFDIALGSNGIRAEGFFVIETPHGERYTRNGSFTLGREGYVVTKEGFRVMGENGPIRVKENNFRIDIDGNIFYNAVYDLDDERQLVSATGNQWEQTELFDRLKIVHFYDLMGQDAARYLNKQGGSLWQASQLSGEAVLMERDNPARPQVLQGVLETSSVNAISEMVNMIAANRAYEANQRTVQTADNTIDQIINRVLRSN